MFRKILLACVLILETCPCENSAMQPSEETQSDSKSPAVSLVQPEEESRKTETTTSANEEKNHIERAICTMGWEYALRLKRDSEPVMPRNDSKSSEWNKYLGQY